MVKEDRMRAPLPLDRRRIAPHRCFNCGGPAEADCIDNLGQPYKGCSRGCRIKTAAEIEEMIHGR